MTDLTQRPTTQLTFRECGERGDAAPQPEEGRTQFRHGDKDLLVGVPFWITSVQFKDGNYGDFVTVQAVLEGDEHIIFSGGGAGFSRQLAEMVESDQLKAEPDGTLLTPIFVQHGLRLSKYTWRDKKGQEQPGETFYLHFRESALKERLRGRRR